MDIEPDGFDGPEPTAMEINQPAYVSIRIGVRGNRATGAFFYRLYVTTLVDGIIDGLGDDIPLTLDLGPENLAPGAREEVWVPVTLTAAILPGDYILGYVLDSVGDVAETDETNNAAQTSGTMTVYSDGDLAAGADLIVILEDPPEGPPPPPTVYYVTDGATSIPWPKMITANFGTRGVGAGVTDVRFYLSPDMDTMTPGDDFFLGSHTCAALDAGKYQFLEPPAMDAGNQLDFTGIGSGIYYLFAVIDEGFVVDEMDEANNTSEQPPFGNWIEVDILGAPQPDIYARTMRADDSTYSIEDWGTEVWGRVTVQNTALDVGCPASAIALYISTDNNPVIGGGDVFLAAYPCGLLGPGEIAEGEIRGRLPFTPATGTDYYMKLVVDALDEVVEMDEGNNVTASEAFQFTDNRTFPGGLDIERVSVDFGGGDGDAACYRSSISSDGRYVAFDSSATDLVAGDGNGVYDVFVRDRQTDATTRVSVDSGGGQGFGNSTTPSISADGRYVAFQSLADTLVGGDTNTVYDVFVHDRQTGETTRVSVDSGGIEGDNASSSSSISADGRYVAFSSLATNLVLVDGNGSRDVFVHDRQTGTTEMVSVDSGGTEGNGNSNWPSISADGRYVAFESLADNLDLMLPDVNGVSDIFVHDRLAGETTRVSVDSGGSEGNNASYGASISAYGRYVAFESLAWNLVPGDGNGFWDIFVRDRQTLETTRASLTWTGGEANGDCLDASISSDGQYVAFQSWSDILVPGDGNAMRDIFVRDRQASQTVRVSVDAGGGEVNGDSYVPAISGNGRYVAFGSDATNLVIGDGNSVRDIFAAPNPLAP